MAIKITIIGWYGTETIGDRAILFGIIKFLSDVYGNVDIYLGSLYPFFSHRTLAEDYDFYKKFINNSLNITLFDSKKNRELNKAIKHSDLIIMGGGPLMHIDPLFMVEYAFKKAKKLNKKTAILGCGIGPLFTNKHKKSVINICLSSDLIILRDNVSKLYLSDIFKEYEINFNLNLIHISYDPAIQCSLNFLELDNTPIPSEDSYIAVNLRSFPGEYSKKNITDIVNQNLIEIVKYISNTFKTKLIKLIPMHYFHIGTDDREFLNYIALKLNHNNIAVQNKNLNLEETLTIYKNAYLNIGMRFHSVVLQTILNGKNFILDYTEPNKGKIFGFINEIDKQHFYQDRYLPLQEDLSINSTFIDSVDINNKFTFDSRILHDSLTIYKTQLEALFL
ncbi:Polysaccharide pyruvyl transferase family protein [Candidatus Magnetomoraceae bacterium gMMP-15]